MRNESWEFSETKAVGILGAESPGDEVGVGERISALWGSEEGFPLVSDVFPSRCSEHVCEESIGTEKRSTRKTCGIILVAHRRPEVWEWFMFPLSRVERPLNM